MPRGNNYQSLKKWWEQHPEKRSEFAKKQMADPLRRLKQVEIGSRFLNNPDAQAKSLLKRMKNPVMQAGPQNHSGKIWRLRDSRGRVHEFRNLKNFIRENEHLFAPEDVEWKKRGGHIRCRADALANLHPDRTRPFGQWKGWTWHSVYERRFNDGQDLLNRCPTKSNHQMPNSNSIYATTEITR